MIRKLQKQVRNFFGVSSTEANAFLVLFPLMIILLVLFPFYHHFLPSNEVDLTTDREQLQHYIAELQKFNSTNDEKTHAPERFISFFDPNIAPYDDLITLGLDSVTAARLIKFRNSGFKFEYKEDLLKVYGIDREIYSVLKEKVILPAKPVEEPKFTTANTVNKPAANKEEPKISFVKENPEFNINLADSLTLEKLRGIGPVLSSRIIRYRDILGGFIDTTQYKEVYGVKGGALEQLFLSAVIEKDFVPITININKSDASELAQHPYISWGMANAITAYRDQHGRYGSLDDLKKIKIIKAEELRRIKPYLSL